MAKQLVRLDRTDGDIDTLMGRIAHTRTWTYISHRADWLDDSAHWQDRTRAIEDRLSDALHEQLTQRFIDRRNAALTRSRGKLDLEALTEDDGGVFIDGERVGRLDGLKFVADDAASAEMRRLLAATANRALQGEVGRRIAQLLDAPDDAFALDGDGGLLWQGTRIGALVRGADILTPAIRIPPSELLPAHLRDQAEARLRSWFGTVAVRPLRALHQLSNADLQGAARGLAFQLCEGLGSITRSQARAQIAALQPADRKALRAAGVRLGAEGIFLPALTKPAAIRLRAILWAVWNEAETIEPPAPGRVTVAADTSVPDGFYAAVGFLEYGGRAIRLDILDRLSVRLKNLGRKGPFALPTDIAPLLGLGNDETAAILAALGYRPVKDGTGFEFRPLRRSGRGNRKTPGRNVRKTAAPTRSRGKGPIQGSPFAALADLRLPS